MKAKGSAEARANHGDSDRMQHGLSTGSILSSNPSAASPEEIDAFEKQLAKDVAAQAKTGPISYDTWLE